MYEKQSISKGRLWTSYGLQGLVSGMFLMGIVNNLMQTVFVKQLKMKNTSQPED